MLVAVAECAFLMNDTWGAYERLRRAQQIVGKGQDALLDDAVVELRVLLDNEQQEEDKLGQDVRAR
jgi:hypothetical protein